MVPAVITTATTRSDKFPGAHCSGIEYSIYALSRRSARRARHADIQCEEGQSRKKRRLLCQSRRSLFKLIAISIGSHSPEILIALLCDSDQVILETLTKPILNHTALCAVAACPPTSSWCSDRKNRFSCLKSVRRE